MILEKLETFKQILKNEEKKESTIKQYNSYITELIESNHLKDRADITKEKLINYKKKLMEKHHGNLNSVNIKIIVINKFMMFLGLPTNFKLKKEKQQKQNTLDNTLTLKEYEHLRNYAKTHKQEELYYLMGTLQGTGIRISELKYITVETIKKQEVTIENKGKIRKIPIQDKVKKELLKYCKENNITKGIIFKNKNNKPLDKSCVWRKLQKLVGQVRSGIKKSKVHPHSFRHLFAKEFIARGGNQLDLADILGHENLETTRIYTTKSIKEQREMLNKMQIQKNILPNKLN